MTHRASGTLSAPFAVDWLGRRPYRDFHSSFQRALASCTAWPTPEQYDALVSQVPQEQSVRLPRFVTESREALRQCGGYEQHVASLGAVPTRPESWHDFFNMSVWAHFPRLRWALNSLHVDAQLGPKDPRNGRAPSQNLAATFDEAGMLVVSTSRRVLAELQALRFKHVFWELRDELMTTTRFWLVGHGMLESLLQPHANLAARSLQLYRSSLPTSDGDDHFRFEVDALAAERIRNWRVARAVLDPVPLLAIPGYADNDSAAFYDDQRNIRFEPISRRPAAPSLAAHAGEPVGDGGRGDATREGRIQRE
jgi:Protein of unknown function (DUF3025)